MDKLWAVAFVIAHCINRSHIMIVLKKGNHYEHTDSREVAQAKVNDGFEVIKNSFGGPRIVKQQAEPKKKMFSKKKK